MLTGGFAYVTVYTEEYLCVCLITFHGFMLKIKL